MLERTDLQGLSGADVADRVDRGLVNRVPRTSTRTVGQIVRANVVTPVNLVIGILAALVLLAGSPKDALFGGVIIANSVIGVVQEVRAKRTLDALQVVSAPQVHVVRDGRPEVLTVDQLVLDDLVELRAGRQIVADGRVQAADNLEIDESLLTGESEPVLKGAGDEVLSGSTVIAGTGFMQVTSVGAENYAAKLAEEARRFTLVDSPLRNDVNRIVTVVGYLLVPVGLLLASSQFFRRDEGWREALISTVAGLVGMVPEGLVLLTSVAFAVGVVRLGKRRCLVQELPAIEVLARVDVLCADKTGTITEGSLALAEVAALDGTLRADAEAALAAMAASDPDPNSTMLAVRDHFREAPPWTMTDRLPFSSARKLSAMSFDGHGTWILGAPEFVLAERLGGDVARRVSDEAARGRRVLLLARTPAPLPWDDGPATEAAALVLFEDVIRGDAGDTLSFFSDQGVTLKVISGDSPTTVAAVARRAGLADWAASVDARSLPDDGLPETLREAVEANTVFGRVSPHQKRTMVKALQAHGHTVAMTGDGVNDVLALKDADCGVAMASGSEATRGVAQIVLMDSNFSALPFAVAEGRRVINNIERVASLFLAKTTYSIILSTLTGVFAWAYPLRPIHLSILSWFTIGVPAFFLALEPDQQRVSTGFLRRVLGRAVPAGIVIAGATLVVYGVVQLDRSIDSDHARSVAVLVAGSVALMNLYRVAQPMNPFRLALVAVMITLFALAFLIPWSRDLFELPLTAGWSYGVAAAAIVLAYPLLVLGDHRSRAIGASNPVLR